MPQYIRYTLEDGSTLLIEAIASEGGIVRAGIGEKIEDAKASFDAALDSVRLSALQIRKKLHDVQADEVEVTFGLKATSEIGNNLFAVGKAGVEANYEVTLKWAKKPFDDEMNDRIQAIRRAYLKRIKTGG